MYGLTRATTTLIGAALAGLLVYIGVRVGGAQLDTAGEYWSVVGLVALAGFVLALSQLLGGWTKWGRPRISRHVLLIAFLPVLFVTTWIVLADQPENDEWLRGNILDWSDDIGVGGLVDDLRVATAVLVFGAGAVFGFTLDTAGPKVPSTEPVVTAPPRRLDEQRVEETRGTHEEPARREEPTPAGPQRRTDE
jgi:hypothetical protein